jgi:thiol:disulfide interchange protein
VWLVWVLGQQTDLDAVLMLLLSLVVISFAAWVYGLWQRSAMQSGYGSSKTVFLLSLIALSVMGGVSFVAQTDRLSATSSINVWGVWSKKRVSEALAQGQPVFVDFTAAWCVSCQVNKKAVLERDSMKKFFADQKIVLLRADWTKRDNEITQELARFARNGVPMYQVWLPTKDPKTGAMSVVLLPELLTQDAVLAAFK